VFSFLKRRWFIALVGFLLIAIFIWYLGPYFAFGSWKPLEPEFSRLVAIALVVGLWALWRLVKWLRASRASDMLVGAVLRQSKEKEKEQPSAEQAKLRERFEEAVAALKQQRRGGASLYDLPWYVFIGAPGSGKTTALMNSGLRFPLEQRVGKGAIRGVGGTRNCDWWFTDEAVFLDTAGRYTTQDSDASSDSEGWKEFLTLLTTYRKRRPLNGVVLTISAQDLLTQGEGEHEAHVDAARRRLNELTRELQIQLPVYLMVTKCDMVPGFTEYFDDLTQDGRAQVWGVTFPYEQTLDGSAPNRFEKEFDALMARLNGRLFARLEEERGARRRSTIFAFPQQMSALRDALTQFVSDVFSTSHADPPMLLRGVYFTSGTQDGTQIDRLLGAIGRRFGVAEAVAPPPGRGKAYFVERLLKTVVIGESGLAGVNRRLELRKAAWQIGVYALTVFVVVVGLTALSISYSNNRTYLDEVSNDVAALRRVRPGTATASIEAFLPYLNAVRAVSDSANRYQNDKPWSMRWGLFQGSSVGNAARDAYQRELDSIVLPRFAQRVRQRLVQYAAEPEKLYAYLKAYLMLSDSKHLDKKHLQFIADVEWKGAGGAGAANVSPATHFESLLQYGDSLRPLPVDPTLVARARGAIRAASIPQLMYGQVQRAYAGEDPNALRLDVIAGVGIEKVLRRKSGRKLSEPISSLYTKKAFDELVGGGMTPLVAEFAKDRWVWGSEAQSLADSLTLAPERQLLAQVTDLYEKDYARKWDELLDDLDLVPFPSVQQYADALGILAGPTSPLRGVLKTVVDNTTLVSTSEAAPGPPPSLGSRIVGGARDIFEKGRQAVTGGAKPGTGVTQHFAPIHRFMAGAPAPFDGVLEQVRKVRDQLLRLGPQVGGQSSLQAIVDPNVRDMLRALELDAANVPQPVDELVRHLAGNAVGTIGEDATVQLNREYSNDVVARCRQMVGDRYPFGNSTEMTLAAFGDVFGYGGVYDRFFTERMEKFVDRTPTGLAWRTGMVNGSQTMLEQFERVERIRQAFFTPGSKSPELRFSIRLSNVDASATRFYLNVDGQQFEGRPGGDSNAPAVWPGIDKAGGRAVAVFEDRMAAPDRASNIGGPWAWFRLIDQTIARAPTSQETEPETTLQVQTKFHKATVTIEASSAASNPFASRDWRQFRCEP
jgi:type VI secretion system protein ImpL